MTFSIRDITAAKSVRAFKRTHEARVALYKLGCFLPGVGSRTELCRSRVYSTWNFTRRRILTTWTRWTSTTLPNVDCAWSVRRLVQGMGKLERTTVNRSPRSISTSPLPYCGPHYQPEAEPTTFSRGSCCRRFLPPHERNSPQWPRLAPRLPRWPGSPLPSDFMETFCRPARGNKICIAPPAHFSGHFQSLDVYSIKHLEKKSLRRTGGFCRNCVQQDDRVRGVDYMGCSGHLIQYAIFDVVRQL